MRGCVLSFGSPDKLDGRRGGSEHPQPTLKSINAKTTGNATFFNKLIFSLLSQHHPTISQSHPTTHPFIIDRVNSGWGKITKFIRILAPGRRENVPTSNYSRNSEIHICQQKRNPKDFPGSPSFDPAMAIGTFELPVMEGILHREDNKYFVIRGKQEWSNSGHIGTPAKN